MDNFTIRVKLSEAEGSNFIDTGWAYLAARGNHGRDSRPMGYLNGHPRPNGIYTSNESKPQKHLTSPLPACCREQNDTNCKYCSAADRAAEVDNNYF